MINIAASMRACAGADFSSLIRGIAAPETFRRLLKLLPKGEIYAYPLILSPR
jgi:hypothetical protein